MNREIVEKWIEALRSGRYEQARLDFREPDTPEMTKPRFCVMGLGFHIASGGSLYGDDFGSLWPEAWDKELDDLLPAMGINTEDWTYLASQNNNGATFDQLADCLESKLLMADVADEKLAGVT